MTRVCIQFDECKPHWAEQRGYLSAARECGLTNIRITGDFDAKITEIWGAVADYGAFRARVQEHPLLSEGSVRQSDTHVIEFETLSLAGPDGNASLLLVSFAVVASGSRLELDGDFSVELADYGTRRPVRAVAIRELTNEDLRRIGMLIDEQLAELTCSANLEPEEGV